MAGDAPRLLTNLRLLDGWRKAKGLTAMHKTLVAKDRDGCVHFIVEHASCFRHSWSRRNPWCLFRNTGYGGVETYKTASEAKCAADRLNPNLTWQQEQ